MLSVRIRPVQRQTDLNGRMVIFGRKVVFAAFVDIYHIADVRAAIAHAEELGPVQEIPGINFVGLGASETNIHD